MLVCVMCVLMLCSLAGCGNNTGTANDNLNDATSGENYDGSGENGNNTGNNVSFSTVIVRVPITVWSAPRRSCGRPRHPS